MCLAQGHNAVTLVRLEPGALGLESSTLPLSKCAPCRRGGASLAFNADIEADTVQILGDWRSEAYEKYLTFCFEDKIQFSEGYEVSFII